MRTVPTSWNAGVLYSTRACSRCGTHMAPGRDRRERRTWQCGSCGSVKR